MRKPSTVDKGAFTLIELLVSMTVLVLLMVMTAQMMNGVSGIVLGSRKRLDADDQARVVFDRMSDDFTRMFKRADADYIFNKRLGNDNLFFYSEAPGYASAVTPSTASLVGYRINVNNVFYPNTPVLERLGKRLTWDGAVPAAGPNAAAPGSVVFLTYPASAAPTASPTPYPESTLKGNWPTVVLDTSTDDDFQVLGAQVCRFEYCFLLTNGTVSDQPYISPHTAVSGMQDVAAIIVALAILDATSEKIVVDQSALIAALPDPTSGDLQASPPKLMAKTWQDAVNSPTFASTANIPQTAAGQVRIYQRYFYLGK